MDTCSYSGVHQGSFHNCTLVQTVHHLMLLSVMIKFAHVHDMFFQAPGAEQVF